MKKMLMVLVLLIGSLYSIDLGKNYEIKLDYDGLKYYKLTRCDNGFDYYLTILNTDLSNYTDFYIKNPYHCEVFVSDISQKLFTDDLSISFIVQYWSGGHLRYTEILNEKKGIIKKFDETVYVEHDLFDSYLITKENKVKLPLNK